MISLHADHKQWCLNLQTRAENSKYWTVNTSQDCEGATTLCNRHLISNPACTAISIQTVLPEVLRRVQLCSGRALSWCARRETEPLRGLSGVFRFPKISRLLFIDIDPLPRRLTYDIFSVLAQLVNQSTTQKKCADKDQEVLLDTSKTDLYKQYLQDLEVRQDQVFTILFQYLWFKMLHRWPCEFTQDSKFGDRVSLEDANQPYRCAFV